MPKDRHIVVIGNSHTECAIDDSIFIRSVNFSQRGVSPYLLTYVKLKKILEENVHVNTVLLSFDRVKITAEELSDNDIRNFLHTYFFMMAHEEYALLLKRPITWKALLIIPAKNIETIVRFVIKGRISYRDLNIGKYRKLDRDKLEQAIELAEATIENRINTNSDESSGSSFYPPSYLQKIIGLCKEKNVELILFNSPTYRPDRYGNKEQLMDYYNTYLRGTRYMDFSAFPLPEYGYGDIGHLNYKGAEIFSRYLRDNYGELFTPAPR
jgi:hypothetical protein